MGGQGYQPWLLQPFLTPHKCARLSPTPPPTHTPHHPAWNSTSDTVVMKSPELRGSGRTCCSDALQARADKNIKTMTAKYERWTKPQRMAGREKGEDGGSKRWQSAGIYTLNKSVTQHPAWVFVFGSAPAWQKTKGWSGELDIFFLYSMSYIHFLKMHNRKKALRMFWSHLNEGLLLFRYNSHPDIFDVRLEISFDNVAIYEVSN